jgi:hypothetical protein
MNENDYENMNIQKLKSHIMYLKSIVQSHDEAEMKAIKEQCATDLLETFKKNPGRILNQSSWDFLDIKNIEFSKVDFLELVMSLPEFLEQQKKHQLNLTANWLEFCVKNNMRDENFVQYFYHHDVFNPLLKACIENKDYLNLAVSQKTVEFLLQKNLITIGRDYLKEMHKTASMSPDFHSYGRIHGYTPYIEYGLRNNLIEVTEKEIQHLYTSYWPQMPESLREYCREQYTLDHITFQELLAGYFPGKPDIKETQAVQLVVFYPEKDFYNLLKHHELSQSNLELFCKNFKSSFASVSSQDMENQVWNNLTSLLKVLKEKETPENIWKWDMMKFWLQEDTLLSEKTRDRIGKIMLFVKIHDTLITDSPESDELEFNINKNKLKI